MVIPRVVGRIRWLIGVAMMVVPAATAWPQRSAVADAPAFAAAVANGRLANEAFVRSDRLMMDWLTLADPRSGLLPRNTTGDRDIWNAKDCAADLYPFLVLLVFALVILSHRLSPPLRLCVSLLYHYTTIIVVGCTISLWRYLSYYQWLDLE